MTEQLTRRWPAEWEPHKATWMAWPCRKEIWTNGLEKAQRAFAAVANIIAEHEAVHMLINAEDAAFAQKILNSDIELHHYALDDSWARDISPIWVEYDHKPLALNFLFNAWGNKFGDYSFDAKASEHISQLAESKVEIYDCILEGGSIHSNGNGTLLTTEECLLHENRNPRRSKDDLETILFKAFGAKDIIWLKKGIAGDTDTDGHVDNIACFIDEKTILTQKTDDKDSENYKIFQENRSIIKESGTDLIEIPEPEARYVDGKRAPLSYINYYIANDLVLLPAFGCKQDQEAVAMLKDLYPKRTVKHINANDILVGGGGIHCITMQQPLI